MSNIFKTIIVPAIKVEAARNLAECLAAGGVGMFTVKLGKKLTRVENRETKPTIKIPTHFISTGIIDSAFVALMHDADLLFTMAQQSATLRGVTLTATHDDCVNLVTTADVSDEQPIVAMNRLNLQLI